MRDSDPGRPQAHFTIVSPSVGTIDGVTLPEGSSLDDAVTVSYVLAVKVFGQKVADKLYAGAYAVKL